jgi:hypothetical protein
MFSVTYARRNAVFSARTSEWVQIIETSMSSVKVNFLCEYLKHFVVLKNIDDKVTDEGDGNT